MAAWASGKALMRREFVYGQLVPSTDPLLMESGSTCPICQVRFCLWFPDICAPPLVNASLRPGIWVAVTLRAPADDEMLLCSVTGCHADAYQADV